MLPLVSDNEAVGDVVFEEFLDGVLYRHWCDVLSPGRHDDLLLPPRHEQEVVLNKGLIYKD